MKTRKVKKRTLAEELGYKSEDFRDFNKRETAELLKNDPLTVRRKST